MQSKLIPALPEKRYLRVELPSHGMKGNQMSGHQQTAAASGAGASPFILRSRAEPQKKFTSSPRNNLRNQTNSAAVCMPDGEIMSIGGSITAYSSIKDGSSSGVENEEEPGKEGSKLISNSLLKSISSGQPSEVGSSSKRRVSFMEDRKVVTLPDQGDLGSSDEEAAAAHDRNERRSFGSMSGSRPPSSVASEKLAKHAKKVAALVVKEQRPNSRLDDDARKAAQVWNRVLQDDEDDDNDEGEDDEGGKGGRDVSEKSSQFDDDGDDCVSSYVRSNAGSPVPPVRLEIVRSPSGSLIRTSVASSRRESLQTLSAADGNAPEAEETSLTPGRRSKRSSLLSTSSLLSNDHGGRVKSSTSSRGTTLVVDLQDKIGPEDPELSSGLSTAREDSGGITTGNINFEDHTAPGAFPSESQSKKASSKKAKLKNKGKLNPDDINESKSGKSKKSPRSKASKSSKSGGKSKKRNSKHQGSDAEENQQQTIGESSEGENEDESSGEEDVAGNKEKRKLKKAAVETQMEKVGESDHSSREGGRRSTKSSFKGTPPESQVDEYDFVRVEDEFDNDEYYDEEEEEVERYDTKQDMLLKERILRRSKKNSAASSSEVDIESIPNEDKGDRDARLLAAKEERMSKRAAAAEKRRLEVERKRKEKEDQIKRLKGEQERKEMMQEQLQEEGRQRAEEQRRKKEEAELLKLKEQEEAEEKKKRAEHQAEREKRIEEEKRRKREELQRKRKEEDERKKEAQRLQDEEEQERKRAEEEMLAEMEEDERVKYQERLQKEKEEREKRELAKRLLEEEEARKAMEFARQQAILKAHEQATLEQKLKFARAMSEEGEKLGQDHKLSRAFNYSYFELLQMLGVDVPPQ